MKQASRIEYVDLYRGIGILLMVMGHIGFGKIFDHYVHAFHMPMFFFASGYFFKRDQSSRSFFASKVKALLVPYLVYTVVIYALFTPEEPLLYILVYLNSTGFISAALWFLTALFIANCIYWVLCYFIYSEKILNVFVILIALSGSLFHLFYKKPCIFAFDAAMVGCGMMHAGFLFRKQNIIASRMKALSWPKLILALIINGILIIINGSVNMREGYYGIIPLFWLNAIGASILLWIISFKLDKLKKDSKGKVVSVIKKTGKRSLTFLGLNQVVIYFVFRVFPARNNGGLMTLLHNAASLIIVFAILYTAAFLAEVIKNKITHS